MEYQGLPPRKLLDVLPFKMLEMPFRRIECICLQNCLLRLKADDKRENLRVDLDVVLYSHFTRLESIAI